jgi:murein DD-endopeptidase MepM/ murein hydrolase activator NlpD
LPDPELLRLRAEMERAQAELEARQAELDKLALEYAGVENKLEEYQGQAALARQEAAAARQEFAALEAQLEDRLRDMYKSRTGYDAALIEAIIGSNGTLNGLIARVSHVLRFLERDKDIFEQVERNVRRIEQLTAEIEQKESQAAEQLQALAAAKDKALRVLEDSKAEYNSLRERVRVLEGQWNAQQISRGFVPGGPGPASSYGASTYQAVISPGWVFPVQGPTSFINDWGFPRSGGRTHKGNDIMSPRHTPLVAVIDGIISRTSPTERGLGGITVWLKGDDGNSYYYAHLESIAGGIVPGLRVPGGQVLGWVGDTGNARGGETHLHFEIHPGGGAAINPYPTLIKYR